MRRFFGPRVKSAPPVADTLLIDMSSEQKMLGRTGRLVAAFVVLMLLVAAGGTVLGMERSGSSAPLSPAEHPAEWDPRLTDLVAFIERDRGLTFSQPVFVDFLAPTDFKAEVAADSEATAEERQEMDQYVALMRALGLLEGDVDIFDRMDQLNTEDTLAYYDSETERITVRGTELTPALRGTLVHELTHALQDQHFDLDRLNRDDDEWLRSVVEGDASRVETHWADELDDETRAAYDAESGAAAGQSNLDGVPEILLIISGAPYQLGLELVEAVAAVGGNPAVDRALRNPPTSDEQLLDPFRYIARDKPLPVDEPALKRGERLIAGDDTFGSMALYLMLAQRLDERTAMRAVDGWGGDAYVDFERDGQACTRVAFRGDTPTDGDELARALDAWVGTMPAGAASTSVVDGLVVLEACDPGADFSIGEPKFQELLYHPIARTLVAVDFLAEGVGTEESRCLAGAMVEAWGTELIFSDEEPTAAELRRFDKLSAPCMP